MTVAEMRAASRPLPAARHPQEPALSPLATDAILIEGARRAGARAPADTPWADALDRLLACDPDVESPLDADARPIRSEVVRLADIDPESP